MPRTSAKSAPAQPTTPSGPVATDTEVDLLVIGSGTGLAAALSAHELGLKTLVVEKTAWVGGSTARSGGAFWVPANNTLKADGSADTLARGDEYLQAVVGDTAPAARWKNFLKHGPAALDMLLRTTPMQFFWAKGYSDYHPENPGGSPNGRTCECKPFNGSTLGAERGRLRRGVMASPIPMPVTGADYKWFNLMVRTPVKTFPKVIKRMVQGIGGLALKREYMAGGQALAAGLFAGTIRAGIPVWTRASVVELIRDGDRVTGAVVEQDGKRVTVTARKGVVLAAGGFDHELAWRHKYQSPALTANLSLGAEGNTGDGIKIGQDLGAGIGLMDQAWWFPAVAPLKEGRPPLVLLAERSLPGSFMVDRHGNRFLNEACDYMSFGQKVLQRERDGDPVGDMWLVFDQRYRNSYVFAGFLYPRQDLPGRWFKAGVAATADNPSELARAVGLPEDAFRASFDKFNGMASNGYDDQYQRGQSAYDRYYGDPKVAPNPNLRPLEGKLYAVKVVLSDLGTCGGLLADERARVLTDDGTVVPGLYALGNNAANAFGKVYPGAGATIGQGLVFGHIAALDAAGRLD